ncbi:MAG: hypothetical protein A2Y48_09835 [Nitrospirae bacterium RIFCSPLOW2_12_42_9]|nr:MAG: hypothetical protein A2Y48_09835 [Nitrospirae bacterium RIFCSPLOW2_12_42_9]
MKGLLSIIKRAFTLILKYPKIIMAAAIVLLICLIWVGGPIVGIERFETRLLLTIGVLFLLTLSLLFERYRADKGAKMLEQSLRKQAEEQVVSARPDRKEEIEALRNQFDKSISSLKQSKLGKGQRGSAALYALPWYMFIGPPASGKSTALLHSGLQFPALDTSGKGIQGIGGTRNCDWWFTNEAILLDTAGRYITEDDDREEWLGFLDLLKQYRKRKPINGVLAAMSIADIFQCNEEELEAHAKNIRGRIDELIQRLGIVFPVYLVFTKCDLVKGFVEFFEDLSKTERDQLWGVTLSKAATKNTQAGEIFDPEFKTLLNSLHTRRMARLSSAWGSQKIRDIYGFPLQLASGHAKLKRFVEVLFQPNPYHENPLFRGFYFTSGTQEGTPIDRIMGSISRASGLTDMISDAFDSQKEPKSYFIKDLFTTVIFPDSILAGASSSVERQRDYLRVGIFAGAVACSLLAVIGLSFSFVGNKHLISSINSSAIKVSQMDVEDGSKYTDNIYLLDKLGVRVAQLQDYEVDGVPLRLRGGLYRGSSLYVFLRKIYFERFNRLILFPTRNSIELELGGFISGPGNLSSERDSDYYYSLLKAYLMMNDPAHIERDFLDQWLQRIWKDFTDMNYGKDQKSGELYQTVSRQITFYTHQPDYAEIPRINIDKHLMEGTRRELRKVPFTERLYTRVRREASSKLEPYTLDKAMAGIEQDVLINDYKIPGLFTYDGYKNSFKTTIKSVIEISGQEGWILGIPDVKQEDLEGSVERLYFKEYVSQWQRFIESTRMRPVESLSDMVKQMETLSQKDSPLTVLLMDVVKNTDLEGESDAGATGMGSGLLQKVKKGLRLSDNKERLSSKADINPVLAEFSSFHEFVSPSGGGKEGSLLDQYFKELSAAREALRSAVDSAGTDQGAAGSGTNAIIQASRNTDRLLLDLDPDSRRVIGSLLLQPYHVVVSGVMTRAQTDLNTRWSTEIYEPCVQSIGGRYPFKKDGEDAALTDISDFLHPDNGSLWRFYNKDIKPFVEEGKDQWEVKKGLGAGLPLTAGFLENMRQSRMISEGLFPRGTPDPEVSFDLYPYPTPGASEILFRVDGKEFRYRNEPQEWHELTWTGTSGNAGGLLQVNVGGTLYTRNYPGRWGFFKLLSAARVTQVSSTHYQVQWDFSTQGSKALKVRYDLKANSYRNPFKPGLFLKFSCMNKIG